MTDVGSEERALPEGMDGVDTSAVDDVDAIGRFEQLGLQPGRTTRFVDVPTMATHLGTTEKVYRVDGVERNDLDDAVGNGSGAE